jgi:hypothetical protein
MVGNDDWVYKLNPIHNQAEIIVKIGRLLRTI